MKIDRLISIIMILLEHNRISATRLADMFEVTPRTIYRDIETINLAGIPIITYPGAHGGIGIMEQYKIDKKLFTTSDMTALLMGLGSISSTLTGEDIMNTLAKVKSLIPPEQLGAIELKSNQITIDLTTWTGNKSLQPNLEKIKTALNESKYLSFQYSDAKNEKSVREVEPHRLVLKESYWYLHGYCIARQDFRLFKLSRITNLEILDSTFSPREYRTKYPDKSDWIKKRLTTIKLLIDESLKERILEHCGEENIKSYGAHQFIVDFPFAEDELGYDFLLSFGDKCQCLEPENIRREVIQRFRNALKVYESI